MDSNLKKVIGWFEGDNYSESKRELKIRRMAKGGKTVKRYIVYKGDDYDGEVVGSSDTFRGARMIRTRLEKKGVFKDVDTYGISDTENYTYIRKDNKFAKGGKTDEYVAITLKPKKSAYRGGKGEVYKSMQNFYDTINTTDNKDKYEFIHSIFISDSRKSDPKDISEIKVYMIGEKSGFDDVEKRGLYDFFDLVKTKEEVKDYAKGGSIKRFDTMVYWEDEDGQSGEKEYRGVIADSEEKAERHVRAMLEEDFDEMEVYEPYITHVSIEER